MCILVAFMPKNSFKGGEPGGDGTNGNRGNRGNRGTAKTRFTRMLQKVAGEKKYQASFTDSVAFGSYGNYKTSDLSSSWKYCSDGINLDVLLGVHSTDTPNYCQGAFAFVAVHPTMGIVVSRDVMGISPLHIGIDNGNMWFASELKALDHCSWHNPFPIGSKYDQTTYSLIEQFVPTYDRNLFNVLRLSVDKCLNVQVPWGVPWGVLLSGGLHSSIISSLTRFCDRPHGYPLLHTFSIGLENSIELIACKYVAREIRSIHHKITFTVEEGLNTMVEAVHVAESSDLNTVRKCIPILILAKHIAASGVKVVLCGLGANEIFSDETLFTGNIINKCMRSQGVQCLVPFLTSSVIHMANTGLGRKGMKDFFKDCVPKYTIQTRPDHRWTEACENYGEHKLRLIYNTLYPGR